MLTLLVIWEKHFTCTKTVGRDWLGQSRTASRACDMTQTKQTDQIKNPETISVIKEENRGFWTQVQSLSKTASGNQYAW